MLKAETHAVENSGRSTRPYEQVEISISDLVSALSTGRGTIIWAISIAAIVSCAVAFLIPVEYSAEAVILTPQQSQSSLSAMAQLAGAGPGLSGLSLLSGFGLHNGSDLYVGILQSRTIADVLINRFHLNEVYSEKYVQRARKRLARRTTIRAGKDTLIHIQVDDRDPKRAAALANAYVQELSLRNTTVALTEASQRRLFFEGQLAKEKELLATSETALRDTEQFTGLIVPAGQAEALLRSASQLKAEIVTREAQLAGMPTLPTIILEPLR